MAQLDNIPAMLQSGEYVVRKEAVDELGKDTMDMINNADRLGYAGGGLVPQGEHGHSAIDELLALNTLANQRGVDMTRDSAMMNKGGKVLKKAPEGKSNVVALEAYHKFLDDYDPNEYRATRYNYYLENPTDEMWKDVQKHYREATLLESLKDNGWVGKRDSPKPR